MRAIITTRPDGGVIVTWPSPRCVRIMGMGGRWGNVCRGFLDTQIERHIANGCDQTTAVRFVRANAFGGLVTAEALGLIRDYSCGRRGTAHELWNAEELPHDRWFRDAWVRGHNGGPISVSLDKARPIHFHKVETAVSRENARRSDWTTRLFRRQPVIEIDWHRFFAHVMDARDEMELRALLPTELEGRS